MPRYTEHVSHLDETRLPPRRPIWIAGDRALSIRSAAVGSSCWSPALASRNNTTGASRRLKSIRGSDRKRPRLLLACCCCSLGDVEGSGQDGGLQRGRPSRRALPWIHGGELRPRPLHPHPLLSVVMKPHEWSSILHAIESLCGLCMLWRPNWPRSCRLSSSGSRRPSRRSLMPRSRR